MREVDTLFCIPSSSIASALNWTSSAFYLPDVQRNTFLQTRFPSSIWCNSGSWWAIYKHIVPFFELRLQSYISVTVAFIAILRCTQSGETAAFIHSICGRSWWTCYMVPLLSSFHMHVQTIYGIWLQMGVLVLVLHFIVNFQSLYASACYGNTWMVEHMCPDPSDARNHNDKILWLGFQYIAYPSRLSAYDRLWSSASLNPIQA